MTTVTLYHKAALYTDGQRTLRYRTVMAMDIGRPEGPLIFDDDDLTRFVLPGLSCYERCSMYTVGDAAARLYALMARCFTPPRHQCTSRDIATAVLNCTPDKLAGGRTIPPDRVVTGNVYALVDTERRVTKYYAIGVAPGEILTYSRFFGIALLDAPSVIKLWGATKHGIITVGCKA